jgi:hypothetical protein
MKTLTKRLKFPRAVKIATALAIAALAVAPPATTRAGSSARADRASDLVTGLDFDDARRELAAADGDDPRVVYEKARLALYEGDCDGAAVLLARPDVAKTEAGGTLADIARGCARVTAATLLERDEPRAVEIRYQDDGDRALGPYIIDTVVKAREALTKDLGVTWPKPTRITVVRDLMSLSAMTGLPQEAAQTTGTVAVAKWGRVTLLSPRASRHGYSWRDTVTHELTHLAVTRATVDRAPLWLQEGVAKREEIRWRPPGPFDDRPSPDAIVTRGMEMKLDLALDKLGPSIAMLPSADAAMVAFAEVTSFVRFYANTAGAAGEAALPRLLRALREKESVDAALKAASGADLKAWDAKWRAYLAAKPKEPLPAIYGLGPEPPESRDLRERVRLAELLLGRGHASDAIRELDHIKGEGAQKLGVDADASLRHLRARAMEAVPVEAASAAKADDASKSVAPLAKDDAAKDDAAKIESVLGEPKDVVSSYGPWWAIRGRFARPRGDAAAADAYFLEAIADDPLDTEAACQTLDTTSPPIPAAGATSVQAAALRALCDAARKRGEPGIGQD